MSWPMVKLGDVAPSRPLKNPKIENTERVWLLNLDMVEANSGQIIGKIYQSLDEAGSSTHWFDANHVLYSKLRPYLNKVVIPDEQGLATTELVPLLPDPKRLDRNFLAYYLRSLEFVQWISELVAGAKMPRVSMDLFWNHEIPLPPLAEQKRIAAILDKADAIRRKRRQAIQLADDFLRAVFLQMFGDPVTNPKGWEVNKLEKMILVGPTNGLYKPSSEYGQGTRILRIDGFYDGALREQNKLKRVSLSQDEIEKFRLADRSIVINRVNSKEYLGKSCFVERLEEPTVFESNMMNFRVDETKLNPRFLVQQLQMPNIKMQIATSAKDAVNQSSINQTDVKQFVILIPSIALQNKFESVCKRYSESILSTQNSLAEAGHLFNALSQKAFSGEL